MNTLRKLLSRPSAIARQRASGITSSRSSSRGKSARSRNHRFGIESLEQRVLLAADMLRVTEISYDPYVPAWEDIGGDSSDLEFIEFLNTGTETIELSDVTVAIAVDFDFGSGNIANLDPNEYVVIVKDIDAFRAFYTDNSIKVAGEYAGGLKNGGEIIDINGADGIDLQTIEYDNGGSWPGRANGKGSSLEVISTEGVIDHNDGNNWRSSSEIGGSPGEAGKRGDVVITEVLAHTDLPQSDSIELHNTTDAAINIGGWYLSDVAGNPVKEPADGEPWPDALLYRIPDNTIIEAGGYVFFNEGHFNSTLGVGNPKDFSLSGRDGDSVLLVTARNGDITRIVDSVSFGATVNGESLGAWPDVNGRFTPMLETTLGAPNNLSVPRIGPVVISEIMYHPVEGSDPDAADALEFIEIFNPTDTPEPLEQWHLEDFAFPSTLILPARSTLVVVPFDPSTDSLKLDAFLDRYGIDNSVTIVGPYTTKLSNGGSKILLQRPDDPPTDNPTFFPRTLEEAVVYDDDNPWPTGADGGVFVANPDGTETQEDRSLTRRDIAGWGNDPDNWIAAVPTPGTIGPPQADDDTINTDEDTPITSTVLANDLALSGDLDPTSIVVTDPSHGAVVVEVDGRITYSPDVNYSGTDSFSYTVKDNAGLTSNAATVTVHIASVNDVPIAVDDLGSEVNQDQSITISVLDNDSDIDGTIDVASIEITSSPLNGTTTIDTVTGTISYSPNAGYSGNDVFRYRVADNEGGFSNEAEVRIAVIEVITNAPPVANADDASVDQDQSIIIPILDNDSDADGTIDVTSVEITSSPLNGTATVDAVTGTISYSPNAGYVGNDIFRYRVADDQGEFSTEAVVQIVVNEVVTNVAPIANDDSESVDQDQMVSIAVLDNDTDDGTLDLASVSITIAPTHGSATVNHENGQIEYTPDAGFIGADSLQYAVRDDQGELSNEAVVSINVVDTNQAPVAVDDFPGTTTVGVPIIIDVLANDTDADGTIDPTTVTMVSIPQNGVVSVDAVTGHITYTPGDGSQGPLGIRIDTLTYTVRDDQGILSNEASISLGVDLPNALPVANDDGAETEMGQVVNIDVLANDFDPDDTVDVKTIDKTSVVITTQPAHGTVSVDSFSGVLHYIPEAGFSGEDTLTYTVADDREGVSNEATVFITVNQANDAPIASDDLATTDEEVETVIDLLANDAATIGELDPASVAIVADPENGTVVIDAVTGNVTYTPELDFAGIDTFTYTVADSSGNMSTPATVSIDVANINDAPVAVTDQVNGETPKTNALTPITIDVVANDIDVDGNLDPSSVTIVAGAGLSIGTAEVDPVSGAITYTPNDGLVFGGAIAQKLDSFTYTISDTDGTVSNSVTVFVIVTPGPVAPVANNDSSEIDKNSVATIRILINDTDSLPGFVDRSTVTIQAQPSSGTATVVSIAGENQIEYQPNDNFVGTDTFTYTVLDDEGIESNEATVTVVVNPANSAPRTAEDSAITDEELSINIDVLANDVDLDGEIDRQSLIITIEPTDGTAVIEADGTVTYTPNPDFFGFDWFQYGVDDTEGASSPLAYAGITVLSVNDAPIAVDDQADATIPIGVTIEVLANDSDVEGDLSVGQLIITQQPAHGTVSVDLTTGEVQYLPDPSEFPSGSGEDSFRYTVADMNGVVSNEATVTITVTTASDTPYQNGTNRFDVNNDGVVSALDSLMVVRDINASGFRLLSPDTTPAPPPFIDVTGDGIINPFDLISIIRELNRIAEAGGEGEQAEGESAELERLPFGWFDTIDTVKNQPAMTLPSLSAEPTRTQVKASAEKEAAVVAFEVSTDVTDDDFSKDEELDHTSADQLFASLGDETLQ